MSLLGLDPKKFKHIKSDDKSTTLQHKDGHVLTIAHNILSPKMKAQLQALSNVGKEAQTEDQADESRSVKMSKGGPMGPNVHQQALIKEAKGGQIRMDGGGKVPIPDDNSPAPPKKINPSEVAKGSQQGESRPPSKIITDTLEGWWDPKKKAQGGQIKMAEAGAVPDIAEVKDAVSAQSPQDISQTPQIPDSQLHLQRIYNSLVSGNVNNSPDQVNTRPWATFGPSGEPPKSFDSNAWTQAEQMAAQEQKTKGIADQQKMVHAAQDNEVRRRAGILPVDGNAQPGPNAAAPGAPGTQQQLDQMPPGSEQEAPPVAGDKSNLQGQDLGTGDAEDMFRRGLAEDQTGIQGMGQNKGALGIQSGQLEDQRAQAGQEAQQRYSTEFNNLNAERQNHIQDIIDGHIDPNKYWDDHSKIAAGIGMILAGFNPTQSPNAAVNFIKYQMDQNMEAQKQNLNSSQNLLKANLEQFHNIHDATEMTRIMQNDVVAHQLMAAANKAQGGPNGMAANQAKMAAGQLLQESSKRVQEFAMRRMLMGAMNSPQSSQGSPGDEQAFNHKYNMLMMVNPEMAKSMAERHVPGIGDASVPVPDGAKTLMRAHKDVNQIMNEVLNFAKEHSGTLDPKLRSQGNALINQLQSQIRVAEDQGVYKESEANFMRKTIGESPADFLSSYTTVPKVKELQHLKQQNYNNLLQQYGLRPQQLPQAQQQSSPATKTVNGVQYKRGPDGNAVRVK